MSKELASRFTEAEARELTDEIKGDYGALQVKVATAWRGRIWIALGYGSWQEYLDSEFADISLRPPKELEEQVIAELRAAGMSTRGIAAATDFSEATVRRRLESTASNDAVDRVMSLDGKQRPARRGSVEPPQRARPPECQVDDDVVDAEIVDEGSGYGGDRLADELGLEPVAVNMSGRAQLGGEHLTRLVADLHAGGSAPLPMVKKQAKSLELALGSGQVAVHEVAEERLAELGRDVADAVGVLSDLLVELSGEPTDRGRGLLVDEDTVGSVRKTMTNLKVVAKRTSEAMGVST